MGNKAQKQIEELRKLMKWKNLFEIKRIEIAIALLQWKIYREIIKELNCGHGTISNVSKTYKKDKEFYKTKYKWAKEKYWKEMEAKIRNIIEHGRKNNKWFDIWEMVDKLWLEKTIESYNTIWYITRRKINMNYQKPYVIDKESPENAEEILKKKYKWKFK